ncbi:MAG: homoserine kinase [candidate division WOR-3 bacterium]|nr:MAG: homoserine kinase [candidate division WOR-3 bacterium]
MKSVTIRAPSTIANFGPGFDIFALALEHPYIELKMGLTETRSIAISLDGCREDMPDDPEKNCAGLALMEMLKRTKSNTGVLVQPLKTIRVGAGLGSSGACASASVYGLNRLLQLNLGSDQMIEIASQGEIASGSVAHADNVAGAMLGGFVIVKSYNPISVLRMDVPDVPIVIGVMRKTQRTTRSFIPKAMDLSLVKEQLSMCSLVIHAILSGDVEELGKAINKDHISEPVRSQSIPGYGKIKKKLLDCGALGCNVSGGGLSIFAICNQSRVQDVAEVMKDSFADESVDSEIIVTRSSNQGAQVVPSD